MSTLVSNIQNTHLEGLNYHILAWGDKMQILDLGSVHLDLDSLGH